MKVGRNDPCPCGSGEKYKKCCLEAGKGTDLGYKRLSAIQNELVEQLTAYVGRELGEKVISVAMSVFFQDDSDPSSLWQDMIDEFSTVFWPWLFYLFELDVPDIEEEGLSGLLQPNTTVVEMFMQDKGNKLKPLEVQLLSACNRVPFSFFEVQSVQPGQGFQGVNLLTGHRHTVSDISASQELEQGDILFAQIIKLREQTMCIGSAQYKLYPRFKHQILEFRKELEEDFGSVTREVLILVEDELLGLFIALQDALFDPPDLRNTDGDPLSFRTLHYTIASPEEAFQALAPLCVHHPEGEIRNQAELDADNQVHAVQFAWSREGHAISKGVDNTSLGYISIEGNTMTVEVNSEVREEEIKLEITRRLGDQATYKRTDIRSLESVMADKASDTAQSELDEEQKALQNTPEVQEAIREMLTRHWQGWLDSELPALDGQTPRQAVQTADGREAVQALFRDIERQEAHSAMPVSQKSHVDWAKRELGLSDD